MTSDNIHIYNAIGHLAKVNKKCHKLFCEQIDVLVKQASKTKNDKGPLANDRTNTKIQQHKALTTIIASSAKLKISLTQIDYYIDAMLISAGNDHICLDDLINDLDDVESAAVSAQRDIKSGSTRGRPSGINSPFDAFVYRLIKCAKSNGGNLIIYKSLSADDWSGSLLQAIEKLKPILPEGFSPQGKPLCSALDRVAASAGRKPRK